MVFPFTLLSIAFYQQFINPAHGDFPISFSLSNIFLLIFLFPTFYTLSSLLEEDHTMGVLDTVIMTSIFLFLILLMVSYGTSNVLQGKELFFPFREPLFQLQLTSGFSAFT